MFSNDKYRDYLKTMSRFHQYSTRNTLLIHMQKPNATLVAGYGFRKWETEFARYVKKGEHGINILAPTPYKVTEERQKVDPDTLMPILDDDGLPVMELVERQLARFKVVNVFDVSQTDGRPMPRLAENITGDVARYNLFMDTLREISPLPIIFEPLAPDTDGECRMGVEIAIREGMSEIQSVSAAIHEITHAKLHDLEQMRLEDENAKPKDRRTEELEAESVSYAVCQYYDIDTGANSFGYLAEWSKGRDLKELNASLDTVRKTAAELIDAIDKKYRELAKERGIDLTADGPAPETVNISEPIEKPEKEYNLGYGFLGNGITVYNHAEQLNNDYVTVAHIERDRSVAFNDADMPDEIKRNIENVAKTIHDPALDPLKKAEKLNTERPAQPEIDIASPDPQTTIAHRNEYGYKNNAMLPLSNQRAAELFDAGHSIYLLYPDNTEAFVFDRDEIMAHTGLCGIDRSDWRSEKANISLEEGRREAELIFGSLPMYGLYQVKNGAEYRPYRFASMKELEANGLAVDRANYELVHAAPVKVSEKESLLEHIYNYLNTEHPAGFHGRSPSVSDVIVFQWHNEISAHFVDTIGFKDLPSFTGNETPPVPSKEPQTYSQVGNTFETPDYSDSSAAQLETDAMAGKSISMLDLSKALKAERMPEPAPTHRAPKRKEKPSLLGRLEEKKALVASRSPSGVDAHTTNREV